MRLNCSASAFFSSSATSSMASFATYSTSASLIFMGERDLLDPRRGPRLIDSSQQLRPHSDELLSPNLIGNIHDHARAMNCSHGRGLRQAGPYDGRPQFLQQLQIELSIPVRGLP